MKYFASCSILLWSLWLRLTRVQALNYNVYSYAGTAGTSASTGTGGKATSAALNAPRSVWQDTLANSYVVEGSGNCVRKVAVSTSIVSAYVGSCGPSGSSGNGGKATSAFLSFPISMMMDSASKMYICDFGNNVIRSVVASTTIFATHAGSQSAGSVNTGTATQSSLNGPHGVWANSIGEVYISEYYGGYVRFVSTSNIMTTVVGKC